jgi:molybdopterin molybdotransferase
MILYEEAKQIVQNSGRRLGCKTEKVDLCKAVRRVCAENLRASLDIQPFDNSAMDGFAVRLSDLKDSGGVLRKSGIVAAGDPVPEKNIKPGTCVQIMTGAPLPPGAEAVVPVENVKIDGENILFAARPVPGANIRKAGEDFKKGADVLKAGQIIHPQHVMPLAALGIGAIEVIKKPRAAFVSTGRELVDDLSQDLKPGQIYNSNGPYALALLGSMGVDCVSVQTVADDPAQFELVLKNLKTQDVDIIISSGAVSAGAFDFVRAALEKMGAEILFHKVKIKPGKPNLFAQLPNGALYFGLPGNPVATAAGLRFFVQPCLRVMMGMEEEKPVRGIAAGNFKKRPGLKMFFKGTCGKPGRRNARCSSARRAGVLYGQPISAHEFLGRGIGRQRGNQSRRYYGFVSAVPSWLGSLMAGFLVQGAVWAFFLV